MELNEEEVTSFLKILDWKSAQNTWVEAVTHLIRVNNACPTSSIRSRILHSWNLYMSPYIIKAAAARVAATMHMCTRF